MLASLLFALNATIPVILVAAVGYSLNRTGFFTKEFLTVLNKTIYKVLLPVLLFRDVFSGQIAADFNKPFFWYCFWSTFVTCAVLWILSELFIRDKSIIGAFVQGSYRGSIVFLGIPFIESLYGNSGLMPLALVAVVPLYNIFAVILLTIRGENGTVNLWALTKKCAYGLMTNPILIGILAGLAGALLKLELPTAIDKTMQYFASCCAPLALLLIGAEFEGGKMLQKLRPTVAASFIKLILLPLAILPGALALGFQGQDLAVIMLLTGAPATATGYVMSKNLHNDAVLSSSIIMLTTALSPITVTLMIFLLRFANLI